MKSFVYSISFYRSTATERARISVARFYPDLIDGTRNSVFTAANWREYEWNEKTYKRFMFAIPDSWKLHSHNIPMRQNHVIYCSSWSLPDNDLKNLAITEAIKEAWSK